MDFNFIFLSLSWLLTCTFFGTPPLREPVLPSEIIQALKSRNYSITFLLQANSI